jgi:hypothetical protein
MKYIKYFKESSEYNELKEQVELYIVDLIDKGFQVFCEVDHNKTYDYIDITIRPPYDNFKPWDEQDFYYWNDVKDNIIVLTKLLRSEYVVSMVSIQLADGGLLTAPYMVDEENLDKHLENMESIYTDDIEHLVDCELCSITLSLIKNK